MPTLKLVTAPTVEPVSVNEAKAHLRVDTTADDALISTLVRAARQMAENVTRRPLITQTWDIWLDQFPRKEFPSIQTWYSPFDQFAPPLLVSPSSWNSRDNGTALRIMLSPLQSVEYVKYVDSDTGATITLDPSAYQVDTVGDPGMIAPAYGMTWPTARNQMNAVQMRCVVGYGDTPDTVPDAIRQWMLLQMGSLYENREGVLVVPRGKIDVMPFADGLIDSYRLLWY